MSIRWKVAIIIAAVFLALEGVNLAVQRWVVLPSFLTLEKAEAIKDAKRVEEAINREIEYLDALAHDWAAWDDTCDFILSPGDDYIRANLSISAFRDNNLQAICIYRADGKQVWRGFDVPRESQKTALSTLFKEELPKTHPLLSSQVENRHLSDVYTAGIYMTDEGPLVVSSRPVLNSNNEGPVRGHLILAYFIDSLFVERIAKQTHVDTELVPFTQWAGPDHVSNAAGLTEGEKEYLIDEGEGVTVLKVYTTFPDIEGREALVIQGSIDRKIMARGYITMRFSIASLMIAGGVALVLMILLIQWAVLKPLRRLTSTVSNAKREEFDFKRCFLSREDEIGVLGREFENLLVQLHNRSRSLEELNTALIDDIERRKLTEAALRESEERFKTLLKNLPVGVFVHDLDEKILLVNDVACDSTGYSQEELLSKSLGDITPVSGGGQVRSWKKLGMGESTVIEALNLRRDGSEYPVEAHLTRIFLEGKSIVLAIVFDISQRKKAEEALRKSEEKLAGLKKMESMGILAGGVAHELNNVLSGVVSYPELILMDLPDDSKLIKPLTTIQTAGKRAVSIVQDLLMVARGVAVEKHPLNLNYVVKLYLESAESIKQLQLHKDVVVKTELDPQLFKIFGAQVHIGKTVTNLVSNAAEATKNGGEILVKTENRYLDKPLKGYEEAREGKYAVLSVKDTGPGISPEDLERIFEPFYTKKVMGRKGTGMELAIVWNILQEHKGYVDVVSGSEGTTISLYFPVTKEENEIKDAKHTTEDYSAKDQKILVVDDEESQREIFCNMLEILGYRPTAVSGGEEAAEFLKENTVDLVILDMVMEPGINGRETYERILKIHPGQKAIIASGFAQTEDVNAVLRMGAGRFIKKPVQLEKFGMAIKAELSD